MFRQVVYSVTTPERTLAISIPRSKPETTIERAVARRAGGARSPTSGSINWGVTVVTAVINERAEKTAKELVRQRPILRVEEYVSKKTLRIGCQAQGPNDSSRRDEPPRQLNNTTIFRKTPEYKP